jgi:hypothetical protein
VGVDRRQYRYGHTLARVWIGNPDLARMLISASTGGNIRGSGGGRGADMRWIASIITPMRQPHEAALSEQVVRSPWRGRVDHRANRFDRRAGLLKMEGSELARETSTIWSMAPNARRAATCLANCPGDHVE